MFEADHIQFTPVSGNIQVVSDGHYLPAFWSHPELGGPFPGLVLLHDQWGLAAHIRAQARRFAERGYYVIAPDLFNGHHPTSPDAAQALIEQVGEAALPRVTATLRALLSHHKCSDKVGIVGWGLGGRLALHMSAFNDDLLAAVSFYGLPDLTPAELRMLACPVLTLFAEQDSAVSLDQVEALRRILEQSDLPHAVVVYPGVGRGFFDDSHPEAFHAVAAQDAWQRALAFLNEQLDVAPPTAPDEFNPGKVY
jgi:carboxymethylenebutenolidase